MFATLFARGPWAMIFEWDGTSKVFTLLASTGELLGVAKPIPGECWEGRMEPVAGGRSAWATSLDILRDWMMDQARSPHR